MLIASDAERVCTQEHPFAVTCRILQQQRISLSIEFKHIVQRRKIFLSYVEPQSVMNQLGPTQQWRYLMAYFLIKLKDSNMKFSHTIVTCLIIVISNFYVDILFYSEVIAFFLRRQSFVIFHIFLRITLESLNINKI